MNLERSLMSEAIEVNSEAAARQAALEGWVRAGLGSMPLPSCREEFKALGLDVQLALQAADPALFEMFNGTQPLAAEVELRMAAGQLTPADADQLEAAGFISDAARLRREHVQQVWDSFEQGHQQAQEEAERLRPQLEAEAEQRRLESEQRMNAQLRAGYIDRIQSGQLA
jgi:hypothetical protein